MSTHRSEHVPADPRRSPRRRAPSARAILGLAICLCGALSSASVVAGDGFVWIEGEDARQHTMKRHGWYDSVVRESLSGGDWLSHFAAGAPPEAEYSFEIAETAEHDFWIRCNTVARPKLSYQLDGGSWREIDLSRPVGSVNIASDGKPDMRFVGWVEAGKVRLERGRRTIRFRFHSENQNHGAIDCFLFTRRPFRPRGSLKPGERSGKANPGFFAWEPDVDPFTSDALVDLRSLNEKVAGESGRVRAEAGGFVLGDGTPVKFWASNAGPGIWGMDHASHAYLARRLAKSGVNMVRLHGAIYGPRDPAVDRGRLDDLHHLVHAMKREGIYVSLSFFFPLWFHLDGDQRPFMLLFFDEEMQRLYFRWADALLKTPNPYTRMPLGKDPAVAIVEVVNEDSHFFWTFGRKNTSEKRWSTLQKLFGGWLEKRYGSLEKTYDAWGGVREADDDAAAGRIDLYGAWEMTSQGIRANAKKKARIGDQVRFLTENMRGFYEAAIEHFRERCGYDGLVSCSNWHVADAAILDALERYCYMAGDVIDHHGYFDHGHKGEAASWSVRPGHEFTSQSALHLEQTSPIPYVETEGHPHIISEIGWPTPNAYRAEFTFLASTYGSLQGLDGVYSFAIGSAGWDDQLGKSPVSTPVTLGTFPAAALVYRRGYVREAPIVVMDRLDLEDLYALKGTRVHVAGAFDQFRAADIPPGGERRGAVEGIDPLAFYAGRVARSFDGNPEESYQRSLAECIDRGRKLVKSITGELAWDYGMGVVTLNAPKAQGAAGFLGRAGRIRLADVVIEMKNDYGTVTAVSLDDRPIATSRAVLIQTMTVEQFHGFRAAGEGGRSGRIESVGSAPCGVEKFDVTVAIERSGEGPVAVTACDEHGYPTSREVETRREGDALSIRLDEMSPYHVVKR